MAVATHNVGKVYLHETIARTGKAYLTLYNEFDERIIVGNIDNMRATKKALKLRWKLPALSHTSPFTKAVISTDRQILWHEPIDPIRLDEGVKKFELEW